MFEFRDGAQAKFQKKFDAARIKVEENRAVIKRQDKLIVDLQQKNEVCQIAIAQTEELVQHRAKEASQLEMRLREIADERKGVAAGIGKMEVGIQRFHAHRMAEDKRLQEQAEERRLELLAKAAEEKSKHKRGGLRSALSKKASAPSQTTAV